MELMLTAQMREVKHVCIMQHQGTDMKYESLLTAVHSKGVKKIDLPGCSLGKLKPLCAKNNNKLGLSLVHNLCLP